MTSAHARIAGFTLVEMAVVVSIVGLLGVIATSGMTSYLQVRERARAQADAEAARQAIRAFALRHRRLPCPDASTNGAGGREGLGGVCASSLQVGWLPYETLGLPVVEPSARMRYAVGRVGVDLVAPPVATGVDPDLDGAQRLHAALSAAARRTVASDRPYLTGANPAAENCALVVQSNPAFAVIAPVADRDPAGVLAGFDGVNAAGSRCIAAPSRPMDADYDDVVVAEGASALLGWLAANTR